MIKVTLKTSDLRKSVILDETAESPATAFSSQGVNVEGKQISLNGSPLTRDKVAYNFSALGVAADSEITLAAVVKGDGAAC